MRIPTSYVHKCKTVFHAFQALFIFITACVALAVFTKDGTTGGGPKWLFAVCFLSIPALIYLVMVPMWSRAVKYANAYAFLAVDALFTIFWLSAIIATAMYNSSGVKQGAKDKKIDENQGNCTTFAFGSESKCKLSRATVGLGSFILVLFFLTTAISAYYFIQFRKTGEIPGLRAHQNATPMTGLESGTGKEDAWDADTHDIGRDHDGPYDAHGDDVRNRDDEYHQDSRYTRAHASDDDEYALLHSTETDEGRHPGRPLSWGEERRRYNDRGDDVDTGYHGAHAAEPRALSPDGHGARAGQGYSFSGGDGR